jgi:CDP-6-deoxy-D-xylo-4-hexulose-3-dehydrase
MSINEFPRVPYAMTIHDQEEIDAVVNVLKTSTQMGPKTKEFEEKVAEIYGHKFGIGTNSGSSSLYIAMEVLNLPINSEVITPVLTFATTIGCIVKNGLIPSFVDSESSQKFIIDINKIEKMINKNTKAMCIPNLMGNMPDWEELRKIADKYDLKIVEDSADVIGAKYNNKKSGFYSDICITSFYGMHMINCAGNGGMMLTSNEKYKNDAKLLRSWGRSSSLFVDSEKIENRFNVYLDNIQYDAKFIFEKIGYMLEPSELGSAFGLVQLKKLDNILQKRKNNANSHINFFRKYEEWLELPKMDEKVNSYWFAFPMIIKEKAPFNRTDLQIFFEKRNIQTRVIFTGNSIRQPAFKNINKKIDTDGYPVADRVMSRGILIACHHGLNDLMINHIYNSFEEFVKTYSYKK